MALLSSLQASFAGMREGLNLINKASSFAANPANFGVGAPTSFANVLARELSDAHVSVPLSSANVDAREHGQQFVQPPAQIPRSPAPLSSLLIMHRPDLLDAMLDMILGLRMFEANARMVTASNRVLKSLIHLGQ